MDFDRLMQPGRLPEKPWKTDALVRLVVGIVVCWLGGMVAATIVRYFGGLHHIATLRFLAFSISALACFAGAVCVLVRPWPFDNFLRNLLILLLCIYGGFFLIWLATRLVDDKNAVESSPIILLIGVVSLQGMAIVLVHFFLREQHISWAEGFGFSNNPRRALAFGILTGLLVLPVTLGLQAISSYLLQALNFHPLKQDIVQTAQNTEGWQNRLVLGIGIIIIAPLAEEILFRGIIYPMIKRMGYPRIALWGAAILFAAAHVNLGIFIPLLFLAIVLTAIYEYTGNLLACIVAHTLFNAANFIALYFIGN